MKRINRMSKEELGNLGNIYHQEAILIESVKDFKDVVEFLKETMYSYENCAWEEDTLSVDIEGEVEVRGETYVKLMNNLWPAGWNNHYYVVLVNKELFYDTDDFHYLALEANYPFKSGVLYIEDYYKD